MHEVVSTVITISRVSICWTNFANMLNTLKSTKLRVKLAYQMKLG